MLSRVYAYKSAMPKDPFVLAIVTVKYLKLMTVIRNLVLKNPNLQPAYVHHLACTLNLRNLLQFTQCKLIMLSHPLAYADHCKKDIMSKGYYVNAYCCC